VLEPEVEVGGGVELEVIEVEVGGGVRGGSGGVELEVEVGEFGVRGGSGGEGGVSGGCGGCKIRMVRGEGKVLRRDEVKSGLTKNRKRRMGRGKEEEIEDSEGSVKEVRGF
jgi:hypothetical protein